MMRSFFVFLFTVMLYTNLYAQHCPYDGLHLLAIKVTDKQGQMLNNLPVVFYLQETDNPMADSCTSAAGLVKKQLLTKDTFIAVYNEKFNLNGYNTQLVDRLKNAGVFANANMMVSLNQAENTCTLVGKSETVYTNYIYRQRKFVIAYTINNEEVQQVVPDSCIYSLCKSAKEIEKFRPLVIKL
jgi:hypothetical protein